MLNLQNFVTLVQNMAAAVQSSAASLLNLTAGSVLRAILEANASIALWLQWLILQVLQLTRLATSTGTNVDTFVGDYGLLRLPAVAASGSVTFSRYSNTSAAFVPVGAMVKTSDGTRIYQVIADATNAAWNGSTGFTIAAGVTSLNCTVTDVTTNATGALSIGTAGNVSASTITLLGSAISGVDTVNNAAPFTNGVDAESDAALQARFSNYIQTRSRGTLAAVGYAITSVQQGLNYTIQENVNPSGGYDPGNFIVTVDDGTGTPSSTLQSLVSASIAAYRPLGSTWTVRAPTIVNVAIALQFSCATTAQKTATLIAAVQSAVFNYANTLPDGAILPYSRIAMVAYLVDPSIVDVTNVTVNSGISDITPGIGGVIKATVAVS
jgi:uncharacterized phage protein gp47/JayE